MSDTNLEMLKLLHEEWRFRVSHLSSLIIKTTTFNLLLIFLPVIPDKIGYVPTVNIPIFLVPLTGMLFSLIFGAFASLEMRKIIKIKEDLKKNISETAPQLSNAFVMKKSKNFINHNIPPILYVIQVLLALIMVFLTK